jgi:hypothetical protein
MTSSDLASIWFTRMAECQTREKETVWTPDPVVPKRVSAERKGVNSPA